ncbi:hypothetical protein Kpol_2002p64 [Vanderwaltozyma polyspora DSM 70294]|uniref:Autophagy-related protein 27 n=1 Tax=Vanderwaltozyma polyspora (strain ATCC 22028 / DSM 70294 / BCRC 21397 / CBS 2163 / NBRC 10782 / NRRL Y-8283 / UCD 57-17) TaxID=436907 RepID=ATG27_VANPO|nr:uncharacterized protein Kpol_2002p64 [Vanderwaltozyma polyspora DSM 70294]A7TFH9.1 RecName: Full=Autophagy-related protein 27; Flags: Precursor [Vanderwaltozyma polyspora DSM 70294]EDO18993.1 hypothetical protein Kpol_2002p64 [Vanderwaltozyma polyspora DSM 70294]
MLKMRLLLTWVLLVLPLVNALKCANNRVLRKYHIDKHSAKKSVARDTPPSKTTEKWYVNPCEEHPADDIYDGCDKSDDICGIVMVDLPVFNKDPFVIKRIEATDMASFTATEESNALVLRYTGISWGQNMVAANIRYFCDKNSNEDEITSSIWANNDISIIIKGPSGCKKDSSELEDGDVEESSGLSWFTWLFIYAIFFTVVYLVVTSYTQTRGGSIDDFRHDFVERAKQFFTSLPAFVREVVSKVLGSAPNAAERGGYSAV